MASRIQVDDVRGPHRIRREASRILGIENRAPTVELPCGCQNDIKVSVSSDTTTHVVTSLEASAVSVRLRRLWLGKILASPEFMAGDLADIGLDVQLRRIGSTLQIGTPYDFGAGDPFDNAFGKLLRSEAAEVSRGSISSVEWQYDPKRQVVRRTSSNDLDIYSPGDPTLDEYDEVAGALRKRIPDGTSPNAREVIGKLRLVGVSKHRLWFAASNAQARDALGKVPGARAALVTAIQDFQKHEKPLYRVVVDGSYRAKSMLL